MTKLICAAVLVAVGAHSAFSQAANSNQYPKVDVFVGYSANLFNFYDELPPALNTINLAPFFTGTAGGKSGFETSIAGALNRHLAIRGDFSTYFDKETGQGPVTVCQQPNPCTTITQGVNVNKKAFYFMAGPELSLPNHTRITPSVHALFGAVVSKAEFVVTGPLFNHSDSATASGFAMAFGGGIEDRISARISLRGMAGYAGTFLHMPGERDAGSGSLRNHIRLSVGIIFHFHMTPPH